MSSEAKQNMKNISLETMKEEFTDDEEAFGSKVAILQIHVRNTTDKDVHYKENGDSKVTRT